MVELRSENRGKVFRAPPQEYIAYADLIVTLLKRELKGEFSFGSPVWKCCKGGSGDGGARY
jgi:hypothetical protein